MAMTREARARRYLQASMNAGYTGLPDERREAYEAQMRSHERAYPRVREHALAGTDQDFDAPLVPGEREHQQHLRGRHGMRPADAQRIRREMRGQPSPSPGGRPRKPGTRPAARRPGAARRAAATGTGAIAAATSGGGSLWMQIVGWTLALSLIYLLVAGKGAGALGGIVSTAVAGVRTFVAPVDPIKSLEGALGAAPVGSSTSSAGSSPSSSAPSSSGAPASSAASGAPAPAPSSIKIPPKNPWGVPPALLKQDVALRKQNAALVGAGRESVTQAHRREESLIPRSKYPAFYAGR